MSVIKRIYSYTGKARAPHRGECCPSVVSMFPTWPIQGPQNHKTYESTSYSFCDFCPEGRQPCVICYQSNVHFLFKCTPSNMLLLLLAASSSSRLHLFSLISEKEALHFPILHWLIFHYFPFFLSLSLSVPFLTILFASSFTSSFHLVSSLVHLSPFPMYSFLSFSPSCLGFFPTYPFPSLPPL